MNTIPDLPFRNSESPFLPIPLSLAGIGFLMAIALPDGTSGGQGFMWGLLIGFVYLVLRVVISLRKNKPTRQCPKCGAALPANSTFMNIEE